MISVEDEFVSTVTYSPLLLPTDEAMIFDKLTDEDRLSPRLIRDEGVLDVTGCIVTCGRVEVKVDREGEDCWRGICCCCIDFGVTCSMVKFDLVD